MGIILYSSSAGFKLDLNFLGIVDQFFFRGGTVLILHVHHPVRCPSCVRSDARLGLDEAVCITGDDAVPVGLEGVVHLLDHYFWQAAHQPPLDTGGGSYSASD